MRICKYCKKSIQDNEVWTLDQEGESYHHACFSEMQYRADILDKIKAEIEQAADKQFQIAMGITDLNERYTHIQMENAYRHSLNIIDKHISRKAESEE